ncbi:MAG TPA: nucleoside triphosphate pyrophosphohydrolase [Thermoanaerobaculia bacterium]|nr:nucleoside triphosphate pyrophosphohydrolase [Thermoanaerobaculia bacterium]
MAASSLADLVALVDRLRRECPWDREQTVSTLRTYLLEECHETLAAIDAGDPGELQGELGDLLFQVVFLARIASEQGWFDLDAVAAAITRKMIDRHPHVFGGVKAASAREVKQNWETRKARGNGGGGGDDPLASIPRALPALAAAHRQTMRAADLGFDWERDADVEAKIEEELAEWRSAKATGETAAEERELGDLLLSVVNLARRRGINAEDALRATNARFRRRFAGVVRRAAAAGKPMKDIPLAELDRYWEEEKAEEEN